MSNFKLCLFCVLSFSRIPDSINGEQNITMSAEIFRKKKTRSKSSVFVSDEMFNYEIKEKQSDNDFFIEPEVKKSKNKKENKTTVLKELIGLLYVLYKGFFFFFSKCLNIILKIQRVLEKAISYMFFSDYSGEQIRETIRLLWCTGFLLIILVVFLGSGHYFSLDSLPAKILMGIT